MSAATQSVGRRQQTLRKMNGRANLETGSFRAIRRSEPPSVGGLSTKAFQQGRYRVLVATDLASRGIHVENIAHVIKYDLPEVAENFIHRVGRTGRAGNRGTASTLILREQRPELLELERQLGIRFEKMRVDGFPCEDVQRMHKEIPRSQPRRKPGIVRLPGEVLQLQMT